jgi:Reprolysin (M12B) family zinc metalloprotease/Disintegrin
VNPEIISPPQGERGGRLVSALAALLLLSACEQPSPGATSAAASSPDGVSELALDAPLATQVERVDPARPLDAPSDELILRHPAGQLRLVLERHDALVAPGYRTYEVSGGALRERPVHERPPFCHYLGHVVLDNGSLGAVASVTTCDAAGRERFSALLRGESRWVELGPARSGAEGYELSRLELPPTFDDLDAASEPDPWNPQAPALQAQATAAAGAQLNVELLDLNDAARWLALGGTDAAELATLSAANHMANLTAGALLQPQLVVGLVGQLTFVSDPYSVTLSAGQVAASDLLTRSASWGATAPLPEHDVRQLLTGLELQTSTVGLAYVGTMCNPGFAAGIVQANFSTPAVAAIATHELGHTLGMSHDEGLGCGTTFIMAASICTNCSQQPTAFSSCSQASLSQFLSGNVTCLSDPITPATGAASCGNGVVEAGEQCDCGASNCGARDVCCNGASCQLMSGATCSATQACCSPSLCAPRALGTTCRPARSSCDLGETCDGSSALCPADAYLPAGQACDDASGGLCYQGSCQARAAQCTEAEAIYPQLPSPLTPCESTTCGTMRCRSGSACYSLTGRSFADGTPCGASRQCDGTACVPSSQLEPPAAVHPAPAVDRSALSALALVLLALSMVGLSRPGGRAAATR